MTTITASRPGARRILGPDVSGPFNAKTLEGLLERAAQLQALAAALNSMDVFEVHAEYDVDTGQWTGQLYNRCVIASPSLYREK